MIHYFETTVIFIIFLDQKKTLFSLKWSVMTSY